MMRKGFPSDPQTILDNATRPFEIKFAGEGGIDAGGLFRESITEVSYEI